MSDKPTGEWTVEGKAIWNDCNPVGIATSSQEANQIADAHNAALADERKRHQHMERMLTDSVDQMRKDLAAERDAGFEECRRLWKRNVADLEAKLGQLAADALAKVKEGK